MERVLLPTLEWIEGDDGKALRASIRSEQRNDDRAWAIIHPHKSTSTMGTEKLISFQIRI